MKFWHGTGWGAVMQDVVIGDIVTPSGTIRDGWLEIEDGLIAGIGRGTPPAAARVTDVTGSFVLPGVVDGQTHAGSHRGLAGLEPTTRSAVAGGVTTIVDMPYDNPQPVSELETLSAKIAVVGKYAHCDVALYATVMPGQGTGSVAAMVEAGVVAFKISSFESSPTRFPRISNDETFELLHALASTGVPVGLHNEDQELVRAGLRRARAARRDGIAAHSESRPPVAELVASAGFLELAAAAGGHAHLVHFSLARGFTLVEQYRATGSRATGETCVHYLLLDPDEHGAALGARMKVNPPIRPGARDALWSEIVAERVAFVSSDHASWPIENKRTASIFEAGAGVPGVETLLPAFFTEAQRRGLDAPRLTAAFLSARPARFFGLEARKGELRVGADADIAVFTPGRHVWDSAAAHDELNWSPFDGHTFAGRVTQTWVRGTLAWDGHAVTSRPGHGIHLPRGGTSWFG
jgi:allantoinase